MKKMFGETFVLVSNITVSVIWIWKLYHNFCLVMHILLVW